MGRYMERAENLARILDVNETFARDSSEEENWRPILRLHGEEQIFFTRHKEATASEVVHFYTLDRESLSSIRTCLDMARGNARSMRHLLSTEVWRQLNVFHEWFAGLGRRDVRLSRLSAVCLQIKEGCQLHTGIMEGTMIRDQVWYFYGLGKSLERAGQTSRLIDIKSQLLDPPSDAMPAVDVAQWNALLRSAAGYHAFRRIHPSGMTPRQVIDFFLTDRSFPRSIACCIHDVDGMLWSLKRNAGLSGVREVRKAINPLLQQLELPPSRAGVERRLNAHVDRLQVALDDLADTIAATFFR